MAMYTPAQLEELRRITAGLLDHIRRVLRHEDLPDNGTFGRLMHTLHVRYGMQGAAYAVRSWLDTVIDAAPNFNRGEIHALLMANETGTGYQDPRTLPPDYRWAGMALLARIADDQVSLYRLIDQLPPHQVGLYLLRVMQMCGDLLNHYEQPDPPGRPVRIGQVVTVRCTAGAH